MAYPVPLLARQILSEWADELAEKLQRSREAIVSNGLSALDFPSDATLKINLMDGSFAVFRHAFFVVSEQKRALAVFTEHCGYHLFPYDDSSVQMIREKTLYRQSQ